MTILRYIGRSCAQGVIGYAFILGAVELFWFIEAAKIVRQRKRGRG